MTAEKHKGRLQSKGQKSGVNKEGGYTSGEKERQRILVLEFRSTQPKILTAEHSGKNFYFYFVRTFMSHLVF